MADLTSACGEDPGAACEWVWDNTHNEALAKTANWLVDKPLQILIVVVLTFVIGWFLRTVHEAGDHEVRDAEREEPAHDRGT